MNDASLHEIRSSWYTEDGSVIVRSRHQADAQHEFENILRGLRIALLLIFLPPLMLGAFIFLVAALFPIQSPTARLLVPNDCWRAFLSIIVRIGLIPGFVVLIYLITYRRCGSQSKRFLAIFLSVLLVSMFAFVPFQQRRQPVMAVFDWRHQQIEQNSSKSKPTKARPTMNAVSKVDTWNNPPEQESHASLENSTGPR